MRRLLILAILAPCPALCLGEAGDNAPPSPRLKRTVSLSLQSGFASTFQLTLGGTFGAGPAWQSRVAVSVGEVFRKGDSITLSGWNTNDAPSRVNSWIAGASYRARVISRPGHTLHLSAGLQRWRFPTVKTGAQDWVGAWQMQYQTKVRALPVLLTQESWTLFHSPLQKGTLLFTQLYTEHPLVKRDNWKLTLRHGPQHTYSWDFYSTVDHRVVRYAGFVLLSHGKTTLETGYRQQLGLQPRIPDNRFWHVMLSRSF